MGWRDNLSLKGKGSFREIEFFVDSADSSIGRRVASYEYPGRDKPMVEDLGRSARRFDLTCYVLGENYMDDRDRLRLAFEKAGPGPLVHPYWGEMTAIVDGPVSIRESTAEGGIARFTLKLIEFGGQEKTPTVTPDTETAVENEADTAVAAAATELEAEWSIEDAISDVVQEAVDVVNAATSALSAINSRVNAVMNLVDSVGDSITAMSDTVASLVAAPGQLASSVTNIIADIHAGIATIGDSWDNYFDENETGNNTAGSPSIAAAASTPATATTRAEIMLQAFNSMMEYGSDFAEVPTTTPQRIQQGVNQTAFVLLFKTVAVAETCRTAASTPFANYQQAIRIRDALTDAIDDLSDQVGDETYAALADLRAALSKHLIQVAADLPVVSEYTPPKDLPALVLSQMIYGDATHETELIDRNNIRNPAIVPSTAVLEVVTDG
jgi:prophage DNA circulation protein